MDAPLLNFAPGGPYMFLKHFLFKGSNKGSAFIINNNFWSELSKIPVRSRDFRATVTEKTKSFIHFYLKKNNKLQWLKLFVDQRNSLAPMYTKY